MVPTLWSGDTVTVHRRCLADMLPGEVVLFVQNQYFVAHRVMRRIVIRNDVLIVTRGDAQAHDDPPVRAEELLGVVTEVHRGGASRPLRRERSRAGCGVAWLVRHSPFVRSFVDRVNARLRRAQRARSVGAARAPARGHA